MANSGTNTELASHLLEEGKLVAIPTETVYGLAANALNETAVVSIFEAKQRPFFDPLIIHVHALEAVYRYVNGFDERLLRLATAFWPGPLTLLLPKKEIIPGIVTSGLNQVAVRVPNHPLTLELLQKLDFPLAAPSANPFGYVSPTEAGHVNKNLGDKVAYILDGGSCQVGLESTIVGIEDNQVCIYRLGGLAVEDIEALVGKVNLKINNSSNPKAPGQLKSHYAPVKPFFTDNLAERIITNGDKKIALICFGNCPYSGDNLLLYNLSKNADIKEAAVNIFRFLREADESVAEFVLCEKVPDVGLGRAINDRISRAAARD